MSMDRRDFLKYSIVGAGVLGKGLFRGDNSSIAEGRLGPTNTGGLDDIPPPRGLKVSDNHRS